MNNPLDASWFLTQPCAVLDQSQLASFNITRPGEPDTDSEVAKLAGPGCIWRADGEPFRGYGIGFLTGNPNGLADTYRGHKQGQFGGYFEPTTVDDYPAVFNDGTDSRPLGRCNITVGISETLTFRAALTAGGGLGPASCDGAKKLAGAVVATLKASS